MIITIATNRAVTVPQAMSEPVLHAGFSIILVGNVARSVCEVSETDTRGRVVDEAYISEYIVVDVLVMFKTLHDGEGVGTREEHTEHVTGFEKLQLHWKSIVSVGFTAS